MSDPFDEPARRRLVIIRDDGVPALFPPEAPDGPSFTTIGLRSRLTGHPQPPTLDELLSEPLTRGTEVEVRSAVDQLINEGFVDHDLRVSHPS